MRGAVAQRDVQHRSMLGDVDPVAPEHRVDAPAQVGLLGQLQQQLQRLGGDTVLGVVEKDPRRLGRHPFAALRVRCEQVSQMQSAHLVAMSLDAAFHAGRVMSELELGVMCVLREGAPGREEDTGCQRRDR